MSKIRKNDKVEVISGKEKGRQGKVLRVLREKDSALVERLNFVKRHTKAGTQAGKTGGIIEKEAPIKLSKLMLVCPKCQKRTRPRFKKLESGSRIRVCRKCDEHID